MNINSNQNQIISPNFSARLSVRPIRQSVQEQMQQPYFRHPSIKQDQKAIKMKTNTIKDQKQVLYISQQSFEIEEFPEDSQKPSQQQSNENILEKTQNQHIQAESYSHNSQNSIVNSKEKQLADDIKQVKFQNIDLNINQDTNRFSERDYTLENSKKSQFRQCDTQFTEKLKDPDSTPKQQQQQRINKTFQSKRTTFGKSMKRNKTNRSYSILQLFQKKNNDALNIPEYELKTLINVWQFIYKIRNCSYIHHKNNQLSQRDYDLFGDKSSFCNFKKQKKKKKDKKIEQFTLYNDDYHKEENNSRLFLFISTLPILNPASQWLYIWDLIHSSVIILQMFFVPIEWVTQSTFTDQYGSIWYVFIFSSITVFLMNVVITFNVGYYDKGMCNMNRGDIWKKYLKFEFWADLLSIIPQLNQLFLFDNQMRIVNFCIVFKIKSIYLILKKYQEMLSIQQNALIPTLIRLFRLFFNILFAAHVIGCIFLGIASIQHRQDPDAPNWVSKYDPTLINANWEIQYYYCLYWAVTTMTSVGYGDITPSNQYETLFVTFIMFVACFTFAYSFNLIGMLVDDINSNQKVFGKEMRQFQSYFEQKNINKDLQLEVRKYLEYQYRAQNDLSIEDEKNLVNRIPQGMKDKLIESANIQYLDKFKIFKQFSPELQYKLAMKMESKSFLNNEIIYDLNESPSNPCIYFVVKGTVLILSPKANQYNAKQQQLETNFQFLQDNNKENIQQKYTILQKQKKYDFFGEVSFFLGEQRKEVARCEGNCYLLKLTRNELLELVNQNELDKEVFCHIKDQCIMGNTYKPLEINCSNCKKLGHYSNMCNRIHYIPNFERLILKYNYNKESQMRNEVILERTDEKTNDARLNMEDNQEIAIEVVEDLEEEEYESYFNKYFECGPYNDRLEPIPEQNQSNFTEYHRPRGKTILQMGGGTPMEISKQVQSEDLQHLNSLIQMRNQNLEIMNKSNQRKLKNSRRNSQKKQTKNNSFLSAQSGEQDFGVSNRRQSQFLSQQQQQQQEFSIFNLTKQMVQQQQKHEQQQLPIGMNISKNAPQINKSINNETENTEPEEKVNKKMEYIRLISASTKDLSYNSNKLKNTKYLQRMTTKLQQDNSTLKKQKTVVQNQQRPTGKDLLKKLTLKNITDTKQIHNNEVCLREQFTTEFPSINTDIIKYKGFIKYFPNNNIQQIIIDMNDPYLKQFKRRDTTYHLFDRKIIKNQQIYSHRNSSYGLEPLNTDINSSVITNKKIAQKRRSNNIYKDKFSTDQVHQIQHMHRQTLNFKQQKELQQEKIMQQFNSKITLQNEKINHSTEYEYNKKQSMLKPKDLNDDILKASF